MWEVTGLLESRKMEAVRYSPVRQKFSKLKIILCGSFLSEKILLSIMKRKERKIISFCNRILENAECWPDAAFVIRTGLEDEKKHRPWPT